MSRFTALPTPQELGTMKEDLEFKTGEMKKSEQTTVGLAAGMIHWKAKFLYLKLITHFQCKCQMKWWMMCYREWQTAVGSTESGAAGRED